MTLATPVGALWPVATKDVLASVYKPGAAAEAPFRTLRRHGFVSRGTTVHRHANGHLDGTVALFSSLSVDAAALARRGERQLAERFAERAGALEREVGFVEFVTYLATIDPNEASGVTSGRVDVLDSRAERMLRGLADRAAAERKALLDRARSDGFTDVESALPTAGRVVEANRNAVTVDLAWRGHSDTAVTVLPWTMAHAVHRAAAGDFIGVLRQPTSADRIDVQVFPALGLHGASLAPEERPFSPFARTSGPVLLSDEDFERIRTAKPEPFRILVPVEIEE